MEENREPSKTTMTKVLQTKDSFGREYKTPVPKVLIEQGNNAVMLTQRHIEILSQRWGK